MNYGLWRVRLYHEELRQWLQSLRQFGFGLVMLFPMALPALVLIPLLSLGIAANPQTSTLVYLVTLWGYLLVLYCWMSLQRDGITAGRYQLYLSALPIRPRLKACCDAGMLIYGGHFFILGPLVLLGIVLFQQRARLSGAASLPLWLELIPLASMLLFAICYSLLALRRKIPWLSLLLFPLCAFCWTSELSKLPWLAIWGLLLLAEPWLPAFSLKLGDWPQGIYRLLLQADLHSPAPDSFRLVALVLMIALTRVCVAAVHAEVAVYLLYLVSFVTALLLASSLFTSQALRAQYRYYLATLPQSANSQAMQSVCYVLAKTAIGVLLLLMSGIFSWTQWGFWLLCYVATLMGIWQKPKLFLLYPCAVVMAVVVLHAVAG